MVYNGQKNCRQNVDGDKMCVVLFNSLLSCHCDDRTMCGQGLRAINSSREVVQLVGRRIASSVVSIIHVFHD